MKRERFYTAGSPIFTAPSVSGDMAVRRKKVKEVEEDAGLYKEFLLWANSPESVEKKKQIYISDFVAVFGRFPEGWAQEELESANGTLYTVRHLPPPL